MKRTGNDIEFGALLKKSVPEATANEWFTKRLLNRLPEKSHSYRWVEGAIYVVAAMVCVLCWLLYIKSHDFSVLTVRDLLNIGVLASVTGVYVWQVTRRMMVLD